MNVLVIEDDEGVSESLADVLAEEGYDVAIAASGKAALARLAHEPLPSLILLDLMMPEMDGVDFRRAQLADARLRDIPVVVISARPDVAAFAAELRADDWLRKPMSFAELIHVVQNRAVTQVGSDSPL